MVLTIFDTYPYRVCLKIGSTLNFDRHQFLDNSWRERGEKTNLNRITKLKIVIKYLSILVCLNDSRSGSFIPILIHIVGYVPHCWLVESMFFFFLGCSNAPWPTRPLLKRVCGVSEEILFANWAPPCRAVVEAISEWCLGRPRPGKARGYLGIYGFFMVFP